MSRFGSPVPRYPQEMDGLVNMITFGLVFSDTDLAVPGGGTQNKMLCQFTADTTGTPVVAGHIEATAIGNIMVQAVASGAINSIADAREIVRRSFEVAIYEPQVSSGWDGVMIGFFK